MLAEIIHIVCVWMDLCLDGQLSLVGSLHDHHYLVMWVCSGSYTIFPSIKIIFISLVMQYTIVHLLQDGCCYGRDRTV